MIETSQRTGRRTKRAIQDIPEFRAHLRREGIDFATFEKRQALGAGMQMDADAQNVSLNLLYMKVNLNKNRKRKINEHKTND